MRSVVVLAALPLLALVGCAAPGPAAPEQQQVAQAKTCERGEAQTGSMLAKKTCGPALSEEDKRRMAAEVANMVRPSGVTAPGK